MPGTPSNLVYTVTGARTIHLSWIYSSEIEASVFRVTLTHVGGNSVTYTTSTTNITINGLTPFDYEGSNGVQFVASVRAVDSSGTLGDTQTTGNILVPRKWKVLIVISYEHIPCQFHIESIMKHIPCQWHIESIMKHIPCQWHIESIIKHIPCQWHIESIMKICPFSCSLLDKVFIVEIHA